MDWVLFLKKRWEVRIRLDRNPRWRGERENCCSCRNGEGAPGPLTYLMRDWGTLVFTKGIAPCLLSTCTSTLSSAMGWLMFFTNPNVESWPWEQSTTRFTDQGLQLSLPPVILSKSRNTCMHLQQHIQNVHTTWCGGNKT